MAKALRWDVLVGVLLIAVFAAGARTSPSFATVDNLSFALGDLGEIALIALAMTMALLWKAKEVILASVFGGQH